MTLGYPGAIIPPFPPHSRTFYTISDNITLTRCLLVGVVHITYARTCRADNATLLRTRDCLPGWVGSVSVTLRTRYRIPRIPWYNTVMYARNINPYTLCIGGAPTDPDPDLPTRFGTMRIFRLSLAWDFFSRLTRVTRVGVTSAKSFPDNLCEYFFIIFFFLT